MPAFNPVGFHPISVIVDLTIPQSVLQPSPYLTPVCVLELYPSGGALVAASQVEFSTLKTDALFSQHFDGRLRGALTFHRLIYSGTRFGEMESGYGEVEIDAADRLLDPMFQSNTIDGRRALFKLVNLDVLGMTAVPDSYDRAQLLLDATVLDWHLDDSVMRLELRDNSYKLDRPASPNVYGGTGGADGTADMAGKRKPRAFGELIPDPASGSGGNVTPALIDPTNLVYQVNDGAVQAFNAVYDSGLALTFSADYASYAALVAATIVNGSYATAKAVGMFRLGSLANNELTCDVRGDATGGFVNDTASIARRVVSSSLVTTVNEGAFTSFAAAQPAAVGYYLGLDSSKTCKEVLDDLFRGPLGWYGFGRDGVLDCGIFGAPAASAVASYDSTDVVDESMRKINLPSDTNPPPYRTFVASPKNWTVQLSVVAGVTAARAAMLANPSAVAASSNSSLSGTIQAAHLLAQDPSPIDAFFQLSSAAVTEANRRLSLWGSTTRSLYSFKMKVAATVHRIGETISVTYPAWDLTGGKLVVIVGIADDMTEMTVELTVWG